jgi:hypothetical protein
MAQQQFNVDEVLKKTGIPTSQDYEPVHQMEESLATMQGQHPIVEAQAYKEYVAPEMEKQTAAQKAYGEKIGELGKQMETPWQAPQMQPQDYMMHATMMAILGTILGHGGQQSAQGAIQGMTGYLKGVHEGNVQLVETSKKEYDANMSRLKAMTDNAEKQQKAIMDALATDTEKAKVLANQYIAEHAGGITALQGKILSANNMLKAKTDMAKTAWNVFEGQRKLDIEAARYSLEKSGRANQQQFIAQRVINAGNEILASMDAVMKMSKGSRTGMLPYISNKESFMNFLSSAAKRTLSSDEQSSLHTFYTGLKRNLATIEASGTAQGLVGLAQSIGELEPQTGDTAKMVAAKFAETRKIVESTLIPMAESGLMRPEQSKQALQIADKIKEVIPYTISDVAMALNKGGETLGQSSEGVVKGKTITRSGMVESGPNAGRKVIEYSDGSKEYQ